MGSQHPIRIQSMIVVPTMDTRACVEQIIKLADAGCDYARLTTQNLREAENLKEIKQSLRKKGYKIPLIADVHFNPVIAETAARIVEKVRINPGNYVDKKTGKTDYSNDDYSRELDKIRKHLSVLVKICKKQVTALRIGTNHGSLSDRIMSRYGDTPQGMVESAMEYLRICRSLDFHNIVLSMKSSNTRIMVQSTRLLVNQMLKEGMDYPLHLGVTEAGEGEDGRMKSAVGIGALLEDGIGDTIRVSLTEDPLHEIPVAKMLVERYHKRLQTNSDTQDKKMYFNPF
ncbi:MAG: (E)-4-hydroxy-3-methylbut-2-enyl-diphosphate synthase, partial [Bacteroidales bacterium]|nr:(E)-4-hydroxy-3-methylbut-2-enyl-diphosphate synthase [Bacteroidales bacterium]